MPSHDLSSEFSDRPPLSDAAVVEILEFLRRLAEDLESQYCGEIHRYYEERSRDCDNTPLTDPPPMTDDPPF